MRRQFVLDDDGLRRELRRMTDRYTDELFTLPPGEAATVRFPVSRLVVDPERFLDPDAEPMEAVGMGAVYTQTSDGAPLREPAVAARERGALLARFYHPHHEALERAAAAALAAHGRCLILDCHSFPSRPLPYELAAAADQGAVRRRPAICIATDATRAPGATSVAGGLHTPPWLRELAVEVFEDMLARWPADRSRPVPTDSAATRLEATASHPAAAPRDTATTGVAFDLPFSGTIVPLRFLGRDARVLSLMIELRRDLYMDEETGDRLAGFAGCAAAVQAALRRLIAGVSKRPD